MREITKALLGNYFLKYEKGSYPRQQRELLPSELPLYEAQGKKKNGTNSRFLNDTFTIAQPACFFNNAKMHFKLDVFKGLIFVFR